MAPPPKRAGTRHYYEGFVQKRGPRDKAYRRLWAGLRGPLLAFYAEPRDRVAGIHPDHGPGGCGGRAAPGWGPWWWPHGGGGGPGSPRWWPCRARCPACPLQMEVPPDLVLLPGHRFLLQEALREEQQRRKRPRESPSCFYNVSRGEAEQLLERSGGSGNMVLRPGGHGHGISVTTRQMLNGTALIRHYKVIDTGQGYCISVDVPHCCSSLAEVVQYFVEKSKGTLRPLNSEYNQKLGGHPAGTGCTVGGGFRIGGGRWGRLWAMGVWKVGGGGGSRGSLGQPGGCWGVGRQLWGDWGGQDGGCGVSNWGVAGLEGGGQGFWDAAGGHGRAGWVGEGAPGPHGGLVTAPSCSRVCGNGQGERRDAAGGVRGPPRLPRPPDSPPGPTPQAPSIRPTRPRAPSPTSPRER
uniref:SH2 domain-containing protein n=1 Tax=Anas platyrhynchos TaxID=8839 RepID=A0A8B9TA46_ANAPL